MQKSRIKSATRKVQQTKGDSSIKFCRALRNRSNATPENASISPGDPQIPRFVHEKLKPGTVQKIGHNPFDDKEASSGSGPLNLNFQSGRRHRQRRRRHLTFLQFEEMKRLALESLNLEEVIEEVLLPCLPRGEGLVSAIVSVSARRGHAAPEGRSRRRCRRSDGSIQLKIEL